MLYRYWIRMHFENYMKLNYILEQGHYKEYKGESSHELIEKFGAILILVLCLAFHISKKNYLESFNPQIQLRFVTLLQHYDYLIHEFIKPNCLITQYCSIQSLQILSLALQYCLVTGDTASCYELRGRVISMAQQLRLHRCPAAVLGLSGNKEETLIFKISCKGKDVSYSGVSIVSMCILHSIWGSPDCSKIMK